MKKVMISYSHENKVFVEQLDTYLKSNEIDAWLDKRDIAPGFPWRDAIFKAIIDCEYMIICLSPNYVKSQMCRMETYLARCYGKKILPIMVDEECWDTLQGYHEMAGIEGLFILNFVNNKSFGLPLNEDILFQHLVHVIQRAEKPKENYDVYVSYRSMNAEYATQVANHLLEQDINTWIATSSYDVGDNCIKLQWQALMQAKVLIVILSGNTPDSLKIQNEILVALTRKIAIFPVLISGNSEYDNNFTGKISQKLLASDSFEMRRLSDIHWFYPNRPDYGAMIDLLSSTIKKI